MCQLGIMLNKRLPCSLGSQRNLPSLIIVKEYSLFIGMGLRVAVNVYRQVIRRDVFFIAFFNFVGSQ
jgi:hypothetical protein